MKPLSSTARKLLETAPAWMVEASAIAMRHYEMVGEATEVMIKDDNSPLTRADLEVDDLIVRLLSQQFDKVPVVTEERAASHAQSLSGAHSFWLIPLTGPGSSSASAVSLPSTLP
ncbi:inositol monophosphatase family protein [Salaquimonas pukyongi]|uniref:inositol monophosphatase family protein n=1 Tax=Salaquimonas pukyongi TaxID=2712698 RepID=UPI0013BE9AB9|nr:inositol monophosphatase family protein [Salaquimonas pukyongi]